MESIFKLGILLQVTDMVSGPVNRMKMQLDDFARRAEALQPTFDRFTNYGSMLAGAGAVGAVGIGLAIRQFANLEEAQNRLQTTLMNSAGVVSPEYEKLNKLAEQLGTALPGSTKDMVQMFIALREQGVQTQNILGGVGKAAAQFAVLMKMPFAESATMVAKFTEALGIAENESIKFMDILQRLKDAAGVQMRELYEGLKYLGVPLKALRIQGLEAARDISAAVGMMATNSLEGSRAGTNMADMLGRMADMSHRLGKNKGELHEFIAPLLATKGIKFEFFDQGGNFRGIREMIIQLEKLKALNPQQQVQVLNKLFGDQAGRAAGVFVDRGIAGYDAMLQRMAAQADMQQKIAKIMSSLVNLWDTLTGTASNFIAHIGGAFTKLTGLPGLLTMFNNFIGKLDELVVKYPNVTGAVAALVLSVVTLTLVVGVLFLAIGLGGSLFVKMAAGAALANDSLLLLRTGLSGVIARLGALSAASMWAWLGTAATGFKAWAMAINTATIPALLGLTKAFWGLAVAVAMNPLFWIPAVIALVIAGFLWMYKHIAGFKNLVDYVFFTIGYGLGLSIKGWKSLAGWIMEPFRLLLVLLDKVAPAVSKAFGGAWNAIPDVFKGLTNAGKTVLFGSVAAPPGSGALQPLTSHGRNEWSKTSDGKGARKTNIRIGNIELPGVTNGSDFVKQLQMFVEGYDAN